MMSTLVKSWFVVIACLAGVLLIFVALSLPDESLGSRQGSAAVTVSPTTRESTQAGTAVRTPVALARSRRDHEPHEGPPGESDAVAISLLQSENDALRGQLEVKKRQIQQLDDRYASLVGETFEGRVKKLLKVEFSAMLQSYPVEGELEPALQGIFEALRHELGSDDLGVLRSVATDQKLHGIAEAYRARHIGRLGRAQVRRRMTLDRQTKSATATYDLVFFDYHQRKRTVRMKIEGLLSSSPQVSEITRLDRLELEALRTRVQEILGITLSSW